MMNEELGLRGVATLLRSALVFAVVAVGKVAKEGNDAHNECNHYDADKDGGKACRHDV